MGHWIHTRVVVAAVVVLLLSADAWAQSVEATDAVIRVMTFNILQGGGEAKNVGFDDKLFGGSRMDEIAAVIRLAEADVVGVQEDCPSDHLLKALGDGWQRVGSIYSRCPIDKVSVQPYLTVVEIQRPGGRRVTMVNCHWFPSAKGYGPDLAQAELKAAPQLTDAAAAGRRIAEKCAIPNGARGYNATLKPLLEAIMTKKDVLLTGDFNEPSHLDWTLAYTQNGPDRWVKNPTPTPLRFAVRWPGSVALADAGLIDSFRAVHPDEVRKPGFTWTPEYPDKTPGRRPYGEQVRDRIDRIYHVGHGLEPTDARVIGESKDNADVVFEDRWPSDHRSVVVTFRLRDDRSMR